MVRSSTGLRARVGLLTLILLALVNACTAPVDSSLSPYRAEILAAAKTAHSDFEYSVLKDGKITRAEYVEAVNRYVGCVKSHGITINVSWSYGFATYETALLDSTQEKAMDECTVGTTYNIGALYKASMTNPQRGDPTEIRVTCMVRSGLAPPGFTAQEFIRDTQGDQAGAKLPFDSNDPRFSACMTNPQTY